MQILPACHLINNMIYLACIKKSRKKFPDPEKSLGGIYMRGCDLFIQLNYYPYTISV